MCGSSRLRADSFRSGTAEQKERLSERKRILETRYSEHPGITNDICQPSNSKMYGKQPDITKPRYFPSPLALHYIGFHCS